MGESKQIFSLPFAQFFFGITHDVGIDHAAHHHLLDHAALALNTVPDRLYKAFANDLVHKLGLLLSVRHPLLLVILIAGQIVEKLQISEGVLLLEFWDYGPVRGKV